MIINTLSYKPLRLAQRHCAAPCRRVPPALAKFLKPLPSSVTSSAAARE